MRRQRFVFLMCVLFALIAVVGLGCKNQFLEKPTFGSSNVANNEQSTGQPTGSGEGFGTPSGLKATQGGYREITLSWNPVQDAVRYYVYRANTQFETFVQVGETGDSSTSYTMKVQSGADFYYRVTAVNHAGEESRFSTIVRGTSLAQPLVSGVEGVEGKEDSDVTVYWYMGNVDAYQDLVRYNVICYDEKDTELARVVVDGSKVNETAAVISGLIPNTSYTYTVEAYVVSAQDKVEMCNPIDAATARRLRPNAPENLVVQQGQSKDSITLSFNLPALVDVALPGGFYDQYPLYFKIYRREASSSNTDTGWQLIKADFGKTETKPAEGEVQKVNFGAEDVEYNPGDTVTFTDQTAGLKRGIKYEYKVQSFAYYERDITSQYSASVAIGWLIDQANFRTGEYSPTLNEEKTDYVSATLGFSFEWETLGLDNEYHFILKETRFTLEGDSAGVSVEKETIDTKFNSIAEVNAYVRKFNNLNDGAQGVNVRGYYRYTLTIFNKNNTELLVLNSPGRAVVTNTIDVPVIELFSVSSGYNDKIELQWKHNSKYTYTVEYIDTDNNIETVSDSGTADVPIINYETLYKDQTNYTDGTILTYTHAVDPGKKYEYILRVIGEKISTDSLPIVGRTSVAPEIKGDGYSYDSITVTWQDVPAADFTLDAKYKDTDIAGRYPIKSLQVEGHDAETVEKDVIRTATFDKPNGYTHGNVSGHPVVISITANVPVTRTVHTLDGDVGTSYEITTEKVTSLKLVSTTEHNTMGPAMVQAKADLGIYSDKINLTWKEVPGATAYMVLRSGFHIASNAPGVPVDSPNHLDFQSTDTYLVKKSEDKWTVSLMPSGVSYEKYFSVSRAEDGTFTLSDNLYTAAGSSLKEEDKVTMGQWIARQEQLSWGAPYKYSVLPVTTVNEAIEYDYESSPSSIAVASINLTELPLVIGTTKGYAWNVKATKGTYSKNGENTGVQLTWTNPFTKASQDVGYSVYRAEYDSLDWKRLDKGVEYGQTTYVDETANPGTMYQYMVATGVSSEAEYPNRNTAWVAYHDAEGDEKYGGHRLADGFALPQVPFEVTREKLNHDNSIGGEEKLSWTAQEVAGIDNYLFDGYIIEILNQSVSDEWKRVAKLDFDGAITKHTQYIQILNNKDGLLKVWPDYKHYFRIRTYLLDEQGNEVLSKTPDDSDLVKWGARSLTHEEFLRYASEVMAKGIVDAAGAWTTQSSKWFEKTPSGMTGKIYSTSSGGVGFWGFVFRDLKYNFITVQGRIGAESNATNSKPNYYFTNMTGKVNGSTKPDWFTDNPNDGGWFSPTYYMDQSTYNSLVDGDDITVVVPDDIKHLYSGNIKFQDVGGTQGGTIVVTLNGEDKWFYGFKNYTALPGK